MLQLKIIRYGESYHFKADESNPDSFSNNWKNNSLDDLILTNNGLAARPSLPDTSNLACFCRSAKIGKRTAVRFKSVEYNFPIRQTRCSLRWIYRACQSNRNYLRLMLVCGKKTTSLKPVAGLVLANLGTGRVPFIVSADWQVRPLTPNSGCPFSRRHPQPASRLRVNETGSGRPNPTIM